MNDALLAETVPKKLRRRLIPTLAILFLLCFLDRVNIGYAALTMSADLNIGPEAFGFASGLFFLSYVLFEIPSTLIQRRVGARLWFARIGITWGLAAMACAFVTDVKTLFVLRFILGLAEAGLAPGIFYYLGQWFPARERGRAIGMFIFGLPAAVIIGGPISGMLLGLDGVLSLKGWQWLFIVEGLPSVLMGVFVYRHLTDLPKDAKWLTDEERKWLIDILAAEAKDESVLSENSSTGTAFRDRRILLLCFAFFCITFGTYALAFWLPQIVKSFPGVSNRSIGFISAVPYLMTVIAIYAVAKSSDRSNERIFHIVFPLSLSVIGFLVCGLSSSPLISLIAVSLGISGIIAAAAVIWTLPPTILSGAPLAVSYGLINSVGNLGGFFGPSIIGYLRASFGGYHQAMFGVAGVVLLSIPAVFIVGAATKYKTKHLALLLSEPEKPRL